MNLMLLLGISAGLLLLGVLLGRFYMPDRRPLKQAAEEGQSYARGLAELVEGDPAGAIDELSRALKRNAKAVEAFFALGTLFRQRGEYERAVRVHQAILVRKDLKKATRLRVHHQLALDFRAAGFPRRAVKALEYLMTQNKKRVETYQELATLYVEQKQWEKAAAVQKRLGKLLKEDRSEVQAHLLAQLAEELLEQGEVAQARKQLKRALSASANSVHVLHLLAKHQRNRENHGGAAKLWQRCLSLRPELASLFVPELEQELKSLKKAERLQGILDDLLKQFPGNVHLRLARARLTKEPKKALEQLKDLLKDAPSLLPARRQAAQLVLAEGDPEAIRNTLGEMLQLLERADRGYRCSACGYTEAVVFWHCSSCGAWGSVGVAWGRRSGERARAKKSAATAATAEMAGGNA